MRQAHRQVKLHPGGAEPGQRRHGHRPEAEAEGQEGRRPEAGRRERPLYRCNVHTHSEESGHSHHWSREQSLTV